MVNLFLDDNKTNVSEIERVGAEEASSDISVIKTRSVELLNKWLTLSSYSVFFFHCFYYYDQNPFRFSFHI